MFYKVKKNNVIIDALEDLQCVRFFQASRGILRCKKKDEPQGIISSNGAEIWHVEGWSEFPEGINFDTVTVEEFDDPDRYQEIIEAIRAGEDYSDFEEPEEPQEPEEEEIHTEPTPMERLALLEELIGVASASYIAERSFEAGEIFIIGAKTFKATSAIATGETIVPCGNCIETSTAELINELSKEG